MPMTICVYEDDSFAPFFPLTLLRPVYTLRPGVLPLFRRVERYFKEVHICLAARDAVSSLVAEQHRDYPVNMLKRGENDDVLFLNGRIREFGDLPKLVTQARLSTRFRNGDQTVAVLFRSSSLSQFPRIAMPIDYHKLYKEEGDDVPDLATDATLYERCWQVMADIEHEITADAAELRPLLGDETNVTIHPGACFVQREQIHCGIGTEILPTALLDASKGPILIGANVRIEGHAAIYGPCSIGPNSIVLAGKIAASSIGHTCRVGGEVEESIFMPYVNKYHAGFIGHAVVGSWVNFGAMTTNSDLKNNYSSVRVSVDGEDIDTGMKKVGAFIGDHTKFGIGTLLNTGISVGVCCNIFGGGLVIDKEIKSFSWGGSGNWSRHDPDKAIETARRTTERRNIILSDRESEALRQIAAGERQGVGTLTF